MREILFRGKRLNATGWVYGSYLCNGYEGAWKYVIFDGTEFIQVDPSTVGQFTELLDKNGVKIFESDNCMINGKLYFIRWNAGTFVAESVNNNGSQLLPWEYIGMDIEVILSIHEK
jgi:hypothetical protein